MRSSRAGKKGMSDETAEERRRHGDTETGGGGEKIPVSPRRPVSASFVLSHAAASDLDRQDKRRSLARVD